MLNKYTSEGEKKMDKNELKAKAYDKLVEIEQLQFLIQEKQKELMEINKAIHSDVIYKNDGNVGISATEVKEND